MQKKENFDRSCQKWMIPIDHLPLAMGYVPNQCFNETFELNKALHVGTIFPELFKPFCGRRKGGSCK